MKIRWLLVLLIWAVPVLSMLACPSDLHGSFTCPTVAQFGRTVSFYLVAPGLWLGSGISGLLPGDPHAGASFPAFMIGAACWLALLSLVTLRAAKAIADPATR